MCAVDTGAAATNLAMGMRGQVSLDLWFASQVLFRFMVCVGSAVFSVTWALVGLMAEH